MLPDAENISVELKSAQVRPESVAREMIAFSNSYDRGILLIVRKMGRWAVFSENGEMFCVRLDFS